LWTRIRNFLDDINAKGEKREIPKGDIPSRLRFMNACKDFDLDDRGIISEANLMSALSRSRLRPLPSSAEISKLCKALETFDGKDRDEINYRKILEAPVSREQYSINGIFPKIVSSTIF
jgi:hypothetical protein